jgi:hypothetical protein
LPESTIIILRNYDSRRNQGQTPASPARTGVKAYEVTTVIAAIVGTLMMRFREAKRELEQQFAEL